jgi:hypothetical protein
MSTMITVPPRPRSRRHSGAWWVVVVLSWIVVIYGLLYLALRSRMFPPDLAESFKARPWGIYPHVMLGMMCLAIGPLQFHPKVQRRADLHRTMGKIYLVVAVLLGIVGMYMAFYSFGGWITHIGFGVLGAGVVVTTITAYRRVMNAEYQSHREWMIRSYSLLFGAATLRVWLPLLLIAFKGSFLPAYRVVAWLSWVPNILFAEWYVRRTRGRPLQFGGRPL